MPGVRGTSLIEQCREIRPDVATILFSGFTDFCAETRPKLEHVDLLLNKPLEPQAINHHIRSLLDQPQSQIQRQLRRGGERPHG